MAERNQKVYELVLQELQKNPEMGSSELYEIARSQEKSVASDTPKQFHARYVLPAKRAQKIARGEKPRKPGRRPGRKGRRPKAAEAEAAAEKPRRQPRRRTREPEPTGTDRERVRKLLLQFAQELADAESRSGLVQVLSRVDNYVDRIAAAGRD